ncbi:hypothetical protein OPV22_014826 [Ensete ventricosum]|uniref:Uncharacterized protein n=1 Tax=Ensete ventricosum TaxID=4639 RepID=A0AAV8RBJ7_ENSVE|nr:hypothetical protein OPV22_014826 [Ensete ventricosum]
MSPLARDVLLPASGPVRFIFRPIRGGSRHQVGPLRLHGSRPRRQQRDTGNASFSATFLTPHSRCLLRSSRRQRFRDHSNLRINHTLHVKEGFRWARSN